MQDNTQGIIALMVAVGVFMKMPREQRLICGLMLFAMLGCITVGLSFKSSPPIFLSCFLLALVSLGIGLFKLWKAEKTKQ